MAIHIPVMGRHLALAETVEPIIQNQNEFYKMIFGIRRICKNRSGILEKGFQTRPFMIPCGCKNRKSENREEKAV